MAIAGSLEYSTKIDTNGFEKGLNSLTNSVKNGGTKIKNIVSAIGITKLISKAIGTINNSIDGAVSRIDTLNNFPKVMSNLGIASEDSEKAVKKLSDRLQGIPTTMDDASLSVQRFTSVNGNVDKSTEYFLALNNALLAGGASADIQSSAMEQLSQAYSKGKPDMMEWRSLQTAMPAQLKQVAEAFNMTTDELGEALRNGKLSMDDFMDKIVKLNKNGTGEFQSFEEQAKNSTGGIVTSVANMKTAITRGVSEIIKSVDKGLQEAGFGTLSEVINNIGTIAEKVLKGISNKIPNLINNLQQMAPILITLVAGFNLIDLKSVIQNGTMVEKVFGLISNKAKTLPETFVKISKSFSSFGNLGENILNSFSTIFSGGIFDKIGGLLEPVKNAFDGIILKTSTFTQLVKFNVGESFNQAFPNFSAGISKISGSFGGLFSKISPMLQKFLPAFTKAFNITAIAGLVVAGLGLLQGQFGEQINQMATVAIEQGPTIITNLVNGIVSALPQLIEQGSQLLQTLLNVIITNLPAIIEGGIKIISALVTGLAQQLPTLIPMALELILTLVMGLLDNIDQLIDAGINLIIGLVEGLINAIPILIEKAPEIIEKLIMAIANNLPKIIEAGIKIIVKLAEGLIKAIPQLVSKIPQIISALVSGFGQFLSNMCDIGKNIVEGIWDGIKKAKDWLIGKVKEWCGSILDGIKAFFGIHSPSTLMRDQIGKFIPQGLAVGIEADTDKALKAIDSMNDEIYSKMQNAVAMENASITAKASVKANNSMLNVIQASFNIDGSVDIDGQKAGRILAPSVTKTIKVGGLA